MGNSIYSARIFYNNTDYCGLIKDIQGLSRRQAGRLQGNFVGTADTYKHKPKARAKK